VAAHRYWRLYITAAQSSAETDLAEFYLCTTVGGASVATGGTASADTTFSGTYVPANAFDGNNTTSWASASTAMPHWLQYDFGAGNAKDIVQWGIQSIFTSGYSQYTPKDFSLQYSDDGTTWTALDTIVGAVGWTGTESRMFTVPVPGTGGDNTFDVVYLGQPFADLDKSSSSGNTSLDIVYLAEPIGTTGTGPSVTDSTASTSQAQSGSVGAAISAGSVTGTASTSQAQGSSASVAALNVGSVVGATSQAQNSAASAALASSATVATSQAQQVNAAGPVDAAVAASQAQHASAAASVGIAVQASTSQGQGSSAQAGAITPWQFVSSTRNDSRDGSDAFVPFALAAGDHVVVSVVLTGYTNPLDGSANTSTDRAWTLSVSDTAGNSYVGLTPVRDQVVIGYPQFPVQWLYQFYCVNALGNSSNVVTVAPVAPPPNPYSSAHPTMISTVTVLNSGGPAAEFGSTASAASTDNGTGTLSLPAMQVQPGASVLLDYVSNSSSGETATGWTLVDNYFNVWRTYWRPNNQAATQNTTVSGSGGIRVLEAVALRNAQGAAGTTRQGQTSSASVEISIDFVTSSASTSQAQSGSAVAATAADTTTGTAQAQRTAASASATLLVSSSTSQAQASSAIGAVFQPGASGSAQAQTTAAQAIVASTASSTSSQAQHQSGVAEVTLDASVAGQQAQHAAGHLAGEIGSSVTTASAQRAGGQLANAFIADAATAQAQQVDAQAGVASPAVGATSQGQRAAAESAVGIDTSATTEQRQRVRAAMRGEAVNTVESGQVQHASGGLALSSDAPAATRQGQSSNTQVGVAADTQIEAGQAQHIGDGNVLVVATDAVVTTAQAAQHAAGVLEQYHPRPGMLSLDTKRLHPALAGTPHPWTSLDGANRVRPALSGRVDLRPER
jgi:hypothetical protein